MNRLSHFVHHRFFWLLIGSYVVAGFLPSPGLWLRSVSLGTVLGTQLTLPTLLLSLLLFNAGVGVRAGLLFDAVEPGVPRVQRRRASEGKAERI